MLGSLLSFTFCRETILLEMSKRIKQASLTFCDILIFNTRFWQFC